MLMIDRAYDVVPGKSGKGIKSVSVNEPFFAGHYPDHSIMPGVMIVESMAQLVAVIYVAEAIQNNPGMTSHDARSSVGYLGAIRQMKFRRLVTPGDQLTLHAQLGEKVGALREVSVRALNGRDVVAQGELVVTER